MGGPSYGRRTAEVRGPRSPRPTPSPAAPGTSAWKKTWMPATSAGMTNPIMPVAFQVSLGSSRGPDGREELADLGLELAALLRQRLRRRQHLRGRGAGLLRAAADVDDVGGDLRGAGR